MSVPLEPRRPVALRALSSATVLQVGLSSAAPGSDTRFRAVALDARGGVRWRAGGPGVAAVSGVTVHEAPTGARVVLELDALDREVEEVLLVVAPEPARPIPAATATVVVEAEGRALARFEVAPVGVPSGFVLVLAALQRRDGWRLLPVGEIDADPSGPRHRRDEVGRPLPGEPAVPPAVPPAATGSGFAPPPVPVRDRTSARLRRAVLDERMAEVAPELLGAARAADRRLVEAGLADLRSKVVLCLDLSWSMAARFRSGTVQRFADRILALATRLDPAGEVDVFTFGNEARYVGTLSLVNRRTFITRLAMQDEFEKGTYYGRALSAVRLHAFGSALERTTPWPAAVPVYVMFVTDGATFDPARTRQQVRWSSYEPIYWQFLAVGASKESLSARGGVHRIRSWVAPSHELLHELDELPGRYLDNADFAAVAEPDDLDDDELFSLLTEDYPAWVASARSCGLLPPA